MDDMAVVGHPTAIFSFSFSGKGTDKASGHHLVPYPNP